MISQVSLPNHRVFLKICPTKGIIAPITGNLIRQAGLRKSYKPFFIFERIMEANP